MTLICFRRDTRQFHLAVKSRELADVVKKEGTFLGDHYYVANTEVEKNYTFSKLQSLKITKLENKELSEPLLLKAEDIVGDVSFLEP